MFIFDTMSGNMLRMIAGTLKMMLEDHDQRYLEDAVEGVFSTLCPGWR
jgi:hypothetical protein